MLVHVFCRSDYFAFCCLGAMALSLLHLVVNWQVYTINNKKSRSNLGRAALPPQNTTPSSWARGSHLMHPSLDQPHSPPQTASRSNQPFCFSTPSGQNDRPTDRETDRHMEMAQVCTKSRVGLIMSDAANKNG